MNNFKTDQKVDAILCAVGHLNKDRTKKESRYFEKSYNDLKIILKSNDKNKSSAPLLVAL